MAKSAPVLIGVDAGTTRVRALAFDLCGRLLAEGGAPTPTHHPRPGWAEHAADALWHACASALSGAVSQLRNPADIAGVAVASVGEAAVPLDAQGQPTYRAIAWFDERAHAQASWLEQTLGKSALFDTTGLFPDYLFGLCKILWLRDNEPLAFDRTRRWLNIADYLAWRLSGVAATDFSLASRTLAFDLRKRVWAHALLEAAGVPRTLFQPLRASGSSLGRVTPEAARATGLPAHCVVAVGGHDHIVGAMAAGAWTQGTLLDSLGTAEAILLTLEQPVLDRLLLERGYSQGAMEVDKPLNYVAGAITTSGACVEWFRNVIAGGAAHETLIDEGEHVPPGSHGAGFFPHMRIGSPPERTPHARGAFFGLSPETTRGTLYRALLEGLAFDAANVVENLRDLDGIPALARTLAIGGNSRNRLLMQIKASVYNQPITVVNMAEATSLGAALLAGLAAGVFESLDEALAGLDVGAEETLPNPDLAVAYAAGLSRFKRLARVLDALRSGD